jgi:FKBP-type peptidyl-prolyl cis-trans isomerase FklB
MKKVLLKNYLFGLLFFVAFSCKPPQGGEHIRLKDVKIQTQADTISYGLGVLWADGIKKINLTTVPISFYQGVKDNVEKINSVFTIESSNEFLQANFEKVSKLSWPEVDKDIYLNEIEVNNIFDSTAYAIGFAWANGVIKMGLTEVTPALLTGLYSSLENKETFINYDAADKKLKAYFELIREEKWGSLKTEGREWLKQNSLKEGVVSLPSGLQYKVIKKGFGISPKLTDVVVCNYTGKLIDNSVFDRSADRGEPFKFYPTGVIKGWTEAVTLMQEGDIWEIYVPYELGYGSGGAGAKIPPYATLIFELELLKVEKQ